MALGRGYDNRSYEMRSRLDESVMWTRGKHSMKFGFYYARNAVNSINWGSPSGSFTFSNSMTSQPNAGANYSRWGNSVASFLLGAVGSASTTLTDMTGIRMPSAALFAQDDWRITSTLTLSYGLRWDYAAPPSEVNNKMSSFEPDLVNPGAGGVLGALAFAETYGRSLTDPFKKGFGPRVGMAYQLGGATVLRASGGLYYAMPSIAINSTGYTNSPSFGSPDGYTPVYYWETGSFPQNFVRPPVKSATFSNGQAITWVPRNAGRLPQIVSWTIGIQRQLGPRTAVDISYIGSHSTHLFIGTELNVADAKNLSLGSLLLQPINSPAAIAAGFKEPFPGFASQTGANTVGQSLRPWPQYTSVGRSAGFASVGPDGIGKMNSLQIKANRRLSQGLTVVGYFTWMKSLTNNTAQYPLNRKMGVSVDSMASPVVFGVTWTYELPFGPGKAYAHYTNPAARRLVSGWAVNGFVRYQSGSALGISAPNTLTVIGAPSSFFGPAAKTADYVGGSTTLVTNPRDFDPVKSRYLNAAAFAIPAQFKYGNTAPTLDWLRGFSSKVESIQVGKQTAITERVGFELMLDLSNPFNFHRWLNPGTNIADSLNFGRVTGANEGRTVQISAKVTF